MAARSGLPEERRVITGWPGPYHWGAYIERGRVDKIRFKHAALMIEFRPKLNCYDVMVPKQFGPRTYPVKEGRFDTIIDAIAAVFACIKHRLDEIESAKLVRARHIRIQRRTTVLGKSIDSDEVHEAILKLRGGCRCSWPNAHPPCSVCETPVTDDELLEIGAIDETTYYYSVYEPEDRVPK